jgi:hypothetical protein
MARERHLNENSKRERELFATGAWDCGAGSENRRPEVVLALATGAWDSGAGSENRTRN